MKNTTFLISIFSIFAGGGVYLGASYLWLLTGAVAIVAYYWLFPPITVLRPSIAYCSLLPFYYHCPTVRPTVIFAGFLLC